MSVRGIVRILRLPLFVTAVADVLAGYTVATVLGGKPFDWHLAALLAGTSAGLYLFGMVQNDLVDVGLDRRLKVPRPLVVGELGIGAAVILLILTAGLAAVCAVMLRVIANRGGALTLAIGTFAAINLYNLAAKRGPAYVAVSVMGLCRLLNFAIGVAAVTGIPHDMGLALLSPSGPLWMRHGLTLFFATVVVTGYSMCVRRDIRVSTRLQRGGRVADLLCARGAGPCGAASGEPVAGRAVVGGGARPRTQAIRAVYRTHALLVHRHGRRLRLRRLADDEVGHTHAESAWTTTLLIRAAARTRRVEATAAAASPPTLCRPPSGETLQPAHPTGTS